MPRRIQRMGDFNIHGGMIVQPNNTNVFANFRLVAAGPAAVAPHPPCPASPNHCAALTIPLNIGSVYVNGMPAVAQFDTDTCGDMRMIGSLDVFVG